MNSILSKLSMAILFIKGILNIATINQRRKCIGN